MYSDRLLDFENSELNDLFSFEKNKKDLNYTAGRSVACVDRQGNCKYGIYVSNYGGPTRFYELENNTIVHYKVDDFYNKKSEKGIRYDDPKLKINWGISTEDIIMSIKDKNLKAYKWIQN